MARLASIVGICLVTFGYSKCVFVSDTGGTTALIAGGDGMASGTARFTTTLLLRDSTGLATTNFRFGEPINFELDVQNRTAQTVTLTFPDAQIYEFVVLDAPTGRVRWRWSEGKAFAQVVTQLDFAPYSSKTYTVVWNGVLSNGTQLMPGDYRARGALVFAAFASDPLAPSDMASPVVDFSVR